MVLSLPGLVVRLFRYNPQSMDPARIAPLLAPFRVTLTPAQLDDISTYIDMLLRWNARINLTAVRGPEHIVTRHFGESLFAARHLLPSPDLVDVGSGAGFPGLPMKIISPETKVTLIEATLKKATFLREVIRTLNLTGIDVFPGRLEDFSSSANLITLRAVERFESVLPRALALLNPGGKAGLLIGQAQVDRARELAPELTWSAPISVPGSTNRVLLAGLKSVSA